MRKLVAKATNLLEIAGEGVLAGAEKCANLAEKDWRGGGKRRAKLAGKIFGVAAGEPGIVVGGEAGSARNGGVAVEPEFHEGVGVGGFEIVFAEGDEGFLRGDLRIGDETVDGFLAENVGLVLFPSTESVGDGREEEGDAGEDEQQDGEGGPIVGGADLPAGAEAANQPVDGEIRKPEQADEHGHGEGDAFIDVVEDVVAHFMPDDEENLMGRKFVDGVVPNDDSGGGADTGDVGVEAGDFCAGLHEEHARGWNVEAGVVGELLQLRGERGIAFLQRRKVVEDGINPNGRDEDGEDDDGEGAGPEPEPPAARRSADDAEQEHQQRSVDEDGEAEGLEPIERPTGPGLDRQPIGAFDVLAEDVERQRDKRDEDDGGRQEEQALTPSVGGDALRPVAQGGGPAQRQREQQDEDGPGGTAEVEQGAQAGEGDGLGEDRGGQ